MDIDIELDEQKLEGVDLVTLKLKLEEIDNKLNLLLEKHQYNQPDLNKSINLIKKLYNLIKSCIQ
jgi:hypothetical protein